MTLLSICIPTFNRADLVTALVADVLEISGDFEICVEDDGSDDESFARLSKITDPRLHLGKGPNRGRAGALQAAIARARGAFTMIFDDDDRLTAEGLRQILADCAAPLPERVAGFIYHFNDKNEALLGSSFPVERSNFLALRADHKVLGDKKEVVRTDLLRLAMRDLPQARRVPTSLYWGRIALHHDVLCRNVVIGVKSYRPDGMTAQIERLKARDGRPMKILNAMKVKAFFDGRYRSLRYALRAVCAWVWYAQPKGFGR